MGGTCEAVVVEKEKSIIVTDGSHAEDIQRRIKQLQREAGETDNSYDKAKFRERIASLGGGVAKIKVGGATETEVNDKKLRFADAMHAVRSAQEMGFVPGGGSVLLYLGREDFRQGVKRNFKSADEQLGAEVVFKSLEAPLRQIAENAGDDASEVLFKARGQAFGFGYNAATRVHEDLLLSGVIDPAKVVINAVVNAASIAGMVLT